MNFGEKVKKLRLEKEMTQSDLAKKAGVSLRTIISYEKGERYPKKREVYSKLSAIFDVDTNYLLTENEEFITEAASQYGTRGKQQAEHLVSQISGLFAGGELSQADKDVVMQALQEAYWDAKRDNKKYTPKKHSSKG